MKQEHQIQELWDVLPQVTFASFVSYSQIRFPYPFVYVCSCIFTCVHVCVCMCACLCVVCIYLHICHIYVEVRWQIWVSLRHPSFFFF